MNREIQNLIDNLLSVANGVGDHAIHEDENVCQLVNVYVPLVESTLRKMDQAITDLEKSRYNLNCQLDKAILDRAYWARKAMFQENGNSD